LEQSDLTALEVCEGDTKIRLERNGSGGPAVFAGHAAAGRQEGAAHCDHPADSPGERPSEHFSEQFIEVKSPMVGVFCAAPSPDAGPYVRQGDRVKKGDVLCQIEAMKLLNEIVAETDGEIAEVCARDGQVVEFSQTLFKLIG